MVYLCLFFLGAIVSATVLAVCYLGISHLLRVQRCRVVSWDTRLRAESARLAESRKATTALTEKLERDRLTLNGDIAAFAARNIQYDSLVEENNGLKQDCFNLTIHLKKMDLDQAALAQRQRENSKKANEIAQRYLKETVSWIGDRLNANNFSSCKQRLLNVIDACRSIGFCVSEEEQSAMLEVLQKDFEQAVRNEFARQEQARIKSQIREEESLAREIDKQLKDAQRERAAIAAALEKALKETKDEHSAEVELLRTKLKEAEERAERAISQAQLTRAGHVYVLSNIGSFGEGMFKVGMTRRLDPYERVNELSSASVPFPYDVHMMISCDDAPSLENALHKELHKRRVNKINLRKEFFRVDLDEIRNIVESRHGTVDYHAEPEAFQYRESIDMPDEDFEFIERTAEAVAGNVDSAVPDED
ncbi:MAG: GIY-YIG nuclease family protein [Thermoguttaceae bacterium]